MVCLTRRKHINLQFSGASVLPSPPDKRRTIFDDIRHVLVEPLRQKSQNDERRECDNHGSHHLHGEEDEHVTAEVVPEPVPTAVTDHTAGAYAERQHQLAERVQPDLSAKRTSVVSGAESRNVR